MNPMLKAAPVITILTIFTFSWLCIAPTLDAASLPERDQRTGPPKTLNTLRTFPEITSKGAWQERSREIRQHILVSCGLWPLPEKTPLKAQITGRIERDGYSVEKVCIETYPGFYLGGNLYRPLGKGSGPFPAVLNPHGHWKEGRLVDQKLGSVAARCISFARQGMVAFCYDMVGYNDTAQVKHTFARDRTNLLWNISLMGLQTWNSIRALDFLESLPDVDKGRIGCTGASGGGTQTFMLGAIDGRLAAQAPNVMVSHSMQGGCLCENAPGLRVDYSNMEFAAVPAPRPQILVAATGDWTKQTLTVEGPAIQKIYGLFKAADKLRFVRFDFEHNYNQTSREAVYEWFGQWLLHHPNPSALKEAAYTKEPDEALRVWPDGKMPADALNETQLVNYLIERAKVYLDILQPKDSRSAERFQKIMRPAWQNVLQVDSFPLKGLVVEQGEVARTADHTVSKFFIGRDGKGDRLPVSLLRPTREKGRTLVVLVHPHGQAGCLDKEGAPAGLARELLARQVPVMLVDTFLTGSLAQDAASKARDYYSNYFSTYNRTDVQERVQDLATCCEFGRSQSRIRRVILCGEDRAGLWALLATPAADGVVADCVSLNSASDTELLSQDLFAPGLRRIGAFEGAAALAAPHPLLVHNTGAAFATGMLRQSYASVKENASLRIEPGKLTAGAVVDWIIKAY